MANEAREAENAYLREWRKNNPDKVKAIKKRYWERKAKGKQEAEQKESES